MVGGSGMYEKAVVEGMNDLPEADAENQQKLLSIWENVGIEALQKLLEELDPNYFSIVDKDNPRRLLRAIDIIWQTGKTTPKILVHQKIKGILKLSESELMRQEKSFMKESIFVLIK
jgi:tRNA dimethylallyltransferase